MPELSQGRKRLVLAICCLSLLIVGMDITIVNLALPAIRTDLGASVSGLQWTVDAYTLVLASLLMLGGSTGDRLGRKRVFQAGLIIFTFGSLLCSLAPDLGWLIGARAVQAVGGSMLNPVAMSIITNVFTEPRERARAIGVWGGVVGISLGVGPIVGGFLVETVGWRGIFWINIPIGLVAVVLTALFVPESRAVRARRPDVVGQALVIVVLATATYAIIEAPRLGWVSTDTVALAIVAVVGVIALVLYESRRRDPLLEIRFFRSIPFAGATLIAVFAFASFTGFLFLNTLYLQDVRGLSPIRAGLCTLPMAVVMLVAAPVSGRLVASRGPRLPLLVAGIGLCVGGLMLVPITAHSALAWVLVSYFVFATGFGMVNAPITNTAVSGMPNSQAGVAAAVASTSRQVGGALGVAVVGSVLNSRLRGPLATGFDEASRLAWWIVAGCGLVVLVLGIVTSSGWALRTRERVTYLFAADEQPLPVNVA